MRTYQARKWLSFYLTWFKRRKLIADLTTIIARLWNKAWKKVRQIGNHHLDSFGSNDLPLATGMISIFKNKIYGSGPECTCDQRSWALLGHSKGIYQQQNESCHLHCYQIYRRYFLWQNKKSRYAAIMLCATRLLKKNYRKQTVNFCQT